MARRYRPRKLFKFWLYHDLDEDKQLMEYIDYLHKTRQFVTVLRNGLRLMWTLGQGDTSVLFELFPTLRSQLTPDNKALIEEFRLLIQAQATLVPQTSPRELASGSTPKALPMPPITQPLSDDEDTVVLQRDATILASGTANFLKAAFGFQGLPTPSTNPPSGAAEVSMSDNKEIPGKKALPMTVLDADDESIPNIPMGSINLKKLG